MAQPRNSRLTSTRRAHRKSRNGCSECKRRHIRCDERRPSCANCDIAARTCPFPPLKSGKQKPGQNHRLPKRNARPTAHATLLSPSSEGSSRSTINTLDHTDVDHVLLPPSAHYQSSPLDLDQALHQLTHNPLLRHNGAEFTSIFAANDHRLSSPASYIQLGDRCTPPHASCLPGLPDTSDAISTAIFTPEHLILLRHADAVPGFARPNRSVVNIAVRHIVACPYLMDEVLAFTAFHTSHMYPGSAASLRRLATELQTRALASFKRITAISHNDNTAKAVPSFLFAGILGRHVLADTLVHHHGADFHSFIDRLVDCFHLNRGMRAIIAQPREELYESEISPFLDVVIEAHNSITSPGNECDPLRRLLDDSDLNEASTKACRQAVDLLQQSFDLCHGLDVQDYPEAVSAFTVQLECAFIDVLRRYRPEALMIVAYYGVLLHRCRKFWAFNNAGVVVIHAIAEHLGSYWQEALKWPLLMLETERK